MYKKKIDGVNVKKEIFSNFGYAFQTSTKVTGSSRLKNEN